MTGVRGPHGLYIVPTPDQEEPSDRDDRLIGERVLQYMPSKRIKPTVVPSTLLAREYMLDKDGQTYAQ